MVEKGKNSGTGTGNRKWQEAQGITNIPTLETHKKTPWDSPNGGVGRVGAESALLSHRDF